MSANIGNPRAYVGYCTDRFIKLELPELIETEQVSEQDINNALVAFLDSNQHLKLKKRTAAERNELIEKATEKLHDTLSCKEEIKQVA